MDTIRIRMLGGFHLSVNDVSMDEKLDRTPKGQLMIQHLLLRGELIKTPEMAQLLSLASVSALKTLVSRTRDLLDAMSPALASCLATGVGGYYWQDDPQVQVDFTDFERGATSLLGCHQLTDDARAAFDSCMALYQGDLLGEMAQQEWLAARSSSLQKLYTDLVHHYLDLLQEIRDTQELIRVCRAALVMLPFNEALHLRLADVMMNGSAAGSSYHQLLLQYGKSLEDGIAQLRTSLIQPHNRQAIICSPNMLRQVCELTIRGLDRTGLSLFLVLFMISGKEGVQLSANAMDKIADSLVHHFASGLRRGDVVCQVSENQVAVLLPTASEHSARIALERISRNYLAQEQPDQDPIILTYRLTKLT